MQFLRMSELKKKEERLRESRTFFILGMVTWIWSKKLDFFHGFSSATAGLIIWNLPCCFLGTPL
jgi:hypothetical protein